MFALSPNALYHHTEKDEGKGRGSKLHIGQTEKELILQVTVWYRTWPRNPVSDRMKRTPDNAVVVLSRQTPCIRDRTGNI